MARGRFDRVRASFAVLVALGLSGVLPASSQAAPYEPNDSLPSAAGPLASGQTYEAALETPTDKDIFYFYATSPAAAQATLVIRNLGAAGAAGLEASILDTRGNVVDPLAYFLAGGHETTATFALEPQKYFLEISTGSGVETTFTPGGEAGAFGPYSDVASRCAARSAVVASAERTVRRAQGKLQRATARLRQSRLGTAAERRAARASHRRARAQVRRREAALKNARARLHPWCFIAQ
jgi:hypothetical protein